MTQARFELTDYSTRVLDVVKGKLGLKNRNEALNTFIHMYGEKYAEPEFTPEEIRAIKKISENMKKDNKKPMTLSELDKLLGLDNVQRKD